MYDHLVSDENFRREFLGCDHGDVVINSRTKCLKQYHSTGTICINSVGGEDHFLSYKKVGSNTLYVFDPSLPNGRYGHILPKNEKDIQRVFGVTRIIKYKSHPQLCYDDTFCQTWSLFWNIKYYRDRIKQVKTKSQSKKLLYSMVKMITDVLDINEILDD
jgi:hypothetical protein